MMYKSICRSAVECGAPVWAPVISNTNWKRLQVILQNEALHIAMGSHRMAGIAHFHQ